MTETNPILQAVADKVNEVQALGDAVLREIELLDWLREIGLIPARSESQAALYRIHFLMRNALYQLARTDEELRWHFSAVGVEWSARNSMQSCADSTAVRANVDGYLAAYYLDFANLNLVEAEVDTLLNAFWHRYQHYCDTACGDISAALQTMGLERVENMAALKAQYRRLVMLAHPDRGGTKEQMQRLNSAFNKLKSSMLNPA